MIKDDAFYLGKIAKTHGLKGEVSVSFDMQNPEDYVGEFLYLEMKGELVPHFIEDYRSHQHKAFIRFEGVENAEQAQKLMGAGLYIAKKDLPELEEGNFYFYELLGFEVTDKELGILGKVEEVYDFKTHSVMEVQYKGKEVLIPMHEHIMGEVDLEAQKVQVNLPEGLLDVYLEE